MKIEFPELHDDDITEESDGTFTLSLAPWFDEPITGIPTKKLAREFAYAADQAMREYGRNVMCD